MDGKCWIRLTFVPDFKPVRSRVVPAGTATLFKVMLEQDALFLSASAAPVEPVKVHVALVSSVLTAGAAATRAAEDTAPRRVER
jgi:hypothetical protein